MAGPFIAHRRVITYEAAHIRSCRDEMDADAPAHAVADHGAAFRIDIISSGQIAPASLNNLNELSISGFFLCLVDPVYFAEKLINAESDCGIPQLGKIAGHRLEMAGDAIVMMHDQYSRAGFFPFRMGNVPWDTVFIGV